MAIEVLPLTALAELVQELRAVAAPLSRPQYDALADRLGWYTVSESSKSIIVRRKQPVLNARIIVHLDADDIRNIGIGIGTSMDAAADAIDALNDYYRKAVETAREALGRPADGEVGGDKPHTWWFLPDAALDLVRWGPTVIIAWATPADHAAMLESIGVGQ